MVKLAILSNINIDPLKNLLTKRGQFDVYMGGYNQWQAELLNPAAGLAAFNPDYVFLHVDTNEFGADIDGLFQSVNAFLDRHNNTSFIISNFTSTPYSVFTYTNKPVECEANQALLSFTAERKGIYILDYNRLILLHGYNVLFNDKYWYLGRIRHSNKGFEVLEQELINVYNAINGKSKKVLVLDLDNTLWGGIAAEDGWNNINISQEGTGRIFFEFQQKIKQLKNTGVLLAICSKNNETDAKEVFEKNEKMQLAWDDFVVHKVNWELKSDNIYEIAGGLNLGLDSVVFIDDNPAEREQVKQSFPEVVVPDFPTDISLLNQWFVNDVVYPFFGKIKITDEDADKTNQYKREDQRKAMKKSVDYNEFITQLHINLSIFEALPGHINRIAQLTQKTNQFNLTGKRYTETEISQMLGDAAYKIWGCSYEDKFGNEGITGCAIVKTENKKAFIDTFLLSCRVLGRNIEFTFINRIISDLQASGMEVIEANFVKTPRNSIAQDFYIKAGFSQASKNNYLWILNNN